MSYCNNKEYEARRMTTFAESLLDRSIAQSDSLQLLAGDFRHIANQALDQRDSLLVINAELLKALKPIAEAYSDDPGTDDLYDEQPVSITLGMVRKARAAIKKATP